MSLVRFGLPQQDSRRPQQDPPRTAFWRYPSFTISLISFWLILSSLSLMQYRFILAVCGCHFFQHRTEEPLTCRRTLSLDQINTADFPIFFPANEANLSPGRMFALSLFLWEYHRAPLMTLIKDSTLQQLKAPSSLHRNKILFCFVLCHGSPPRLINWIVSIFWLCWYHKLWANRLSRC